MPLAANVASPTPMPARLSAASRGIRVHTMTLGLKNVGQPLPMPLLADSEHRHERWGRQRRGQQMASVSLYGLLLLWTGSLGTAGALAEEKSPADAHARAQQALHRAVDFFRQQAASVGGGYVHRMSAGLEKREGEGAVGPSTAWVQPPGTPTVGEAYLQAYRLTGDERLRQAAVEAAMALVRGQLESGGWDNQIEFAPEERSRYAYRVDSPRGERNTTTLDDDKSQSATRFLVRLDQALDFEHQAIHAASQYALDAFVRAQHPNGAWPQRYSTFPETSEAAPLRARVPERWPRKFPKQDYGDFYTLNDDTIADMVDVMLLAWQIYDEPRYLAAAEKAGDFLLRAQLPEPQPGWAQQYNQHMEPAWARKFEPPAVTGGEAQRVLTTLMQLYRGTGKPKYLEPLPRAVEYYRGLLLADGQLARFYELGTNRPLYFTRDYQLTYSDTDLPTHYAFKVKSRLDAIERQFQRLRQAPPTAGEAEELPESRPPLTPSLVQQAEELIEALDPRGAWVEAGELRYQDEDDATRQVIRSDTFAENLVTVARYVAATAPAARPAPTPGHTSEAKAAGSHQK